MSLISKLRAPISFIADKTAKERASILIQDRIPGTLQLRCHVKPGASVVREGITSVSDRGIEVCVPERAHDGQANRAVIHVVARALGVKIWHVQIKQGERSRQKTLTVRHVVTRGSPEQEVEQTRKTLLGSIDH